MGQQFFLCLCSSFIHGPDIWPLLGSSEILNQKSALLCVQRWAVDLPTMRPPAGLFLGRCGLFFFFFYFFKAFTNSFLILPLISGLNL